MSKTITVMNEKGGIGKTTVCYNAAWELAKTKKVLIIDMDGQRANLTFFSGIKKPMDLVTIADVLKKGVPMKDAIQPLKENLDIVPATVDVSDISQNVKAKRMKEIVKEVENDYDYIFIDVSPSPDWRHYISLSASDYVIVVMLPDVASLESDNGIVETLEEVKETSNPNLKVLGIVFNRNEERTNMGKQVKETTEAFAKKMDTKIFKSKIRNAVAMGEVPAAHIGITDYDKNSSVAQDVRDFVKELQKEAR